MFTEYPGLRCIVKTEHLLDIDKSTDIIYIPHDVYHSPPRNTKYRRSGEVILTSLSGACDILKSLPSQRILDVFDNNAPVLGLVLIAGCDDDVTMHIIQNIVPDIFVLKIALQSDKSNVMGTNGYSFNHSDNIRCAIIDRIIVTDSVDPQNLEKTILFSDDIVAWKYLLCVRNTNCYG